MRNLRFIVACGAILAGCAAAAGAERTCVWTGQGGDHLWNTPENWSDQVVPGADDTADLSAVDGSGWITNDVENLTVKGLVFSTNTVCEFGPVTLCGRPITLSGATPWVNDVPVTNEVELTVTYKQPTFKIHNSFSFKTNVTATTSTGNVAFGEGNTGYPKARGSDWHVWGTFDARDAKELQVNIGGQTFSRKINFHGPVYAKKIYNCGYNYSSPCLYGGGSIALAHCFYGGIEAGAAYGWPTNMVIGWPTHWETESSKTRYSLNGFDQTIDRIQQGQYKLHYSGAYEGGHDSIYSSSQATLTLRGTASSSTEGRVDANVALVWDPVGDFTQTFSNRTAYTAGPITVRRGAVRLGGHGSFAKVETINIATDAAFECLSTNAASPLAALTTLNVASGGVFRVGRAAENPTLSCPSARVYLEDGAKIEVPEGVTLEVEAVDFCGVYPKADTYAAATCGWIAGKGGVRVTGSAPITSWGAPKDGDWSVAANWTDGVPVSPAKETFVTARGPDYTVTLDTNYVALGTMTVANDGTHVATLAVTGATGFATGLALTVTNGGCVSFGAGPSELTNLTSSARHTVTTGGVWRVTGTATNHFYCGGNSVPCFRDGGLLELSGDARAVFECQQTYVTPVSFVNGRVAASGNGVFAFASTQNGVVYPFDGVDMVFTGASKVSVNQISLSPVTAGRENRLTMRDQASFSNASTLYCGYVAGTRTCLDLGGTGSFFLGQDTELGVNQASHTQVDVRSGATVVTGHSVGTDVGGACGRSSTDWSACTPTGVVNVAGTMTVRGYSCGNQEENGRRLCGLRIGTTVNLPNAATAWCHGTVNVLAGGCLSHERGFLAVGLGYGEGALNVQGGTYTKNPLGQDQIAKTLVGVAGGQGTVSITDGGAMTIPNVAFVGGVGTNEINCLFSNYPDDSLAATGTIRVADGTFTSNGARMIFGAKGTGILEIGAKGTVAAKELVLSNNVASVLRFTLGATAADHGSLALSGALKIAAGAKIEIDGTAYEGGTVRIPLVSAAGGVEGAFAPADIALNGSGLRIKQTPTGLQAVFSRGFALLLK